MSLPDIHRLYTVEGALTVYPTDIGNTSRRYASIAPQRILVWPTGGADSIKPFVDAGISVSVIGCVPVAHPQVCPQIRGWIAMWEFADRLERVLDCDEWLQVKNQA